MKLSRKTELILLGMLAIVAVISIVQIRNMTEIQTHDGVLNPKLYVQLIDVLFLIAIAIRFVLFVAGKNINVGVSKQTGKISTMVMVMMLPYIVGVQWVGFYFSTGLTLIILYLIADGISKKNFLFGLCFSFGICSLLKIAFGLFHIYLPDAVLF